jgi:putative acetyltransferase
LRREDAATFLAVHRASIHGLAASDYPAEVIMDWAPLPVTDEALSQFLEGWDDELRIIAREGARAVGIGALSIENEELTACYVAPADCRRGIGTAIADRLEELALSHGIAALELDSSTTARRFYEARGYEVIAQGKHMLSSGRAMESLRMRKTLDQSA